MPLNREIATSLAYLRRKYRVSERDLMGIAKKLAKEPDDEETWEEITQRYLEQRKLRNAAHRKR